MIGWRALNFVWFGKRKIAVHAAKTTLLNTIYMSITCRKYVTNSMTWWIYPRVFWFPRGRPRGKKTPGYPVDLRLTLGYRQICSKLKKCATPGKLAKIPGGTPGYMALKSTKTTTSGTGMALTFFYAVQQLQHGQRDNSFWKKARMYSLIKKYFVLVAHSR
jgi:hypothetical protein